MAHFIAIAVRDIDGRATGDVETYTLDSPDQTADAREALLAHGLEWAPVLSGDPEESEHVDTGLKLWAPDYDPDWDDAPEYDGESDPLSAEEEAAERIASRA